MRTLRASQNEIAVLEWKDALHVVVLTASMERFVGYFSKTPLKLQTKICGNEITSESVL